MIRSLSLILALMLSSLSLAAIDVHEFRSAEDEQRFHELTAELRCPKCQNQNIADSDSPIAKDLRREVYRMIDDGQGNDEVIDFMVTRYGEFVLYRPKKDSSTWLLWYGPYLLLGLGAVVILSIVAVKRRKTLGVNGSTEGDLSAEDRAKLDALLNKENNS